MKKKIQRTTLNGNVAIAQSKSFNKIKHELMDAIAETSLWVPKDKIENTAVYPNVRRGRAKDKGRIIKNIRIDDNTYANRAIKVAISKGIKFEDYEVCHIWPKTTYDEKYHTLLQNLVLIPRVLSGLSDHLEDVVDMLKYRAWELYGWYPSEYEKPERPEYYPESWGSVIVDESGLTDFDDEISLEDLFIEIDYENDKEAEEIEKVKRKVPKWLSASMQINSTILGQYMRMSQNGQTPVTREQLQTQCEDAGVRDFMGNYNQMKNFGVKNHAKVFEEDVTGCVSLWEPVAQFIINSYK